MLCCNNSTKDDDGKYRGDAVEVALNQYLEKQKIDVETLQKKKKRVLELPFDSKRKMMSTIYEENNGKVIYTKGSLESLLPRCKSVLIDGKIKRDSKIRLIRDGIVIYPTAEGANAGCGGNSRHRRRQERHQGQGRQGETTGHRWRQHLS